MCFFQFDSNLFEYTSKTIKYCKTLIRSIRLVEFVHPSCFRFITRQYREKNQMAIVVFSADIFIRVRSNKRKHFNLKGTSAYTSSFQKIAKL